MIIRAVRDEDWPRIGQLCELLVEQHHAWDAKRFIPVEQLRGDAYTSRVRAEIAHGRATVLVADLDGSIAGYVFTSVEAWNWKELRPEAGYVHDMVVDAAQRRHGVGTALLKAVIDWLGARNITRVVLWTAPQNVEAQRVFGRFGFRTTMMEMTREG